MVTRKKLLFPFLLLILALFGCASTQTADGTGTTSGSARIYAGQTEQAKAIAVDNALHRLVQLKIEDSPLAAQYKQYRPFISIKESAMVHNWKILREKEEDGMYHVQVRGTVASEEVSKTIQLYRKKYSPVYLLLVREKDNETVKESQDILSYPVISKSLSTNNIQLIEYTEASSRTENAESLFEESMSGSVIPQNRKAFSDKLGVDILLIANVAITDQSDVLDDYDTKMKSKRVVVNLRAVDVYTGKILSTASDNAAGVHVDANVAAANAVNNCIVKGSMFGKEGSGDFLARTQSLYIDSLSSRYITVQVEKNSYSDEFSDRLLSCSSRVLSVDTAGENENYILLTTVFAGPSEDLRSVLTHPSCDFFQNLSVSSTSSDTITLGAK